MYLPNIIRRISFIILLWVSAFFLPSAQLQADTYELVTGDDYAPFSGRNLPQYGMFAEAVSKVFERLGHGVKITFAPWKRGYKETLDGNFWGSFPYSYTDARSQEMLFSSPIYTNFVRWYSKASLQLPPQWQDSDLQGKLLCRPIGYSMGMYNRRWLDKGILKLVQAPNAESCMRMVHQGRADLFSLNDKIAPAKFLELWGDYRDFVASERPVSESPNYFIMARSNAEAESFMQQFNQALAALISEGVLREIERRHVPMPVELPK